MSRLTETRTNPYLAHVARAASAEDKCGLCNVGDGQPRAGRLGRYAMTCDVCEGIEQEQLAQAS